jgi:hypothetical protein
MDLQIDAEVLTQTQAAHYLNRGLRTLALWRGRGYGPAFVRIGGAIMYRVADLQTFIERNRVVPGERGRTPSSSNSSGD